MAYAAHNLLAVLLDKFLDHDQYCNTPNENCTTPHLHYILLHKKQQIQSLHENVVFLSTFLKDFPRESAKLESRIAIAAKKADDIFRNAIGSKFRNCPEISNCLKWKSFCTELVKVAEEVDSIVSEVKQIKRSICEKMSTMEIKGQFYGEPSNLQGGTSKNQISNHSSASFSPRVTPTRKDSVVGFEEDMMKVKGRLYGETSKLEIIAIVGMGGIGKTTLARYALDEPSTLHHFDVRVWVTISQNVNLREILFSILRSINAFNKETYEYMENELMAQHVHRYLKGRRYLIVMDDVWNTEVWDDVGRIFPDDLNGSRIIITTRGLDVASYVGNSTHLHEMHLMDVNQSWNLLRQKVFAQEKCPPHLEKIGRLIAENCRGLPLAVVVIAGVLSKVNQMQETWAAIAENVIEAVNSSNDHFSEILSLSYIHLPHQLRPCFLYMGAFPEDHEINVLEVIKLWAAEGFLRSNESKDMEELGDEYMEDLAKRSLVLVAKKRYDGKIKTVRIHDVLRDLCLRKARDDKFLHVINEFSGSFPEGIENSYRRLSVFSYISGFIPNMDNSPIHSILLFQHWAFDFWKNFRHLKVVHAMRVAQTSSEAMRCIRELLHLQYLAFSCDATAGILQEAAESLYQLPNLQTLIVGISRRKKAISKRGKRLPLLLMSIYLPYVEFEIWRMSQLRHLTMLDVFFPNPSPENCQHFSSLENLQTVSRIQDFSCSKMITEMMPNLKKLGIVYSYAGLYESGWSKYGLNNLVHLYKLEKLSLYAKPYPNLKNDVSQNLAFPVALRKLTLSGCRFPWEDMTIVGSLPNLEVLKLKDRACHGTDWETNEGEFCQLKLLLIDSTDLNNWITESSHFPRLEHLVLYECHTLREIPYGIGEIPTLELIEVDLRNSSIAKSAKCIEEEQRSFGNDLQVRLLKSRTWTSRTSEMEMQEQD